MGLTKTLLVAGAGAALAYFLDPVSGQERRRRVRQYWDERMGMAMVADPQATEPEPSPIVVGRPSAEGAGQ